MCVAVEERIMSEKDMSSPGKARRKLNALDLAAVFQSTNNTSRQRVHPKGVKEGPIFRPSEEEFKDALGYILKIAPQGRKFGIIKVIPPENWKPLFVLDTTKFTFKTRKQKLSDMNCLHREKLNYLDQLYLFHKQKGTDLSLIPNLKGEEISMYKLKHVVDNNGGYKKIDQDGWIKVAIEIGYSDDEADIIAEDLKNTFKNIIVPYEDYVSRAKTAKTSPYINKVHDAMINGVKRSPGNILEEKVNNVVNGNVEVVEFKSYSRKRKPSDNNVEIKKENAEISEPSSRSKRKNPRRKPVNAKPGDYCEICEFGYDAKLIILCDSCNKGYHTYCLDPALDTIPENEWFCDQCIIGTGDFGFQEGNSYSLRQFHLKADQFKLKYFPKWESERHNTRFEDEVEAAYWSIIDNPDSTVEVEYGADIHCTDNGSAFPTLEKQPLDPYSVSNWNPNYIPILEKSLLRYINEDISGMTVPWLYVGMCFSTFCWHNEDHFTYSLNYQHFGDTKSWYGVPGDQASLFEKALESIVPELFEKQPDLLGQLVSVVNPTLLIAKGVSVYSIDQHPGEFIITFPQAYHSGFNHGFNFNEAVNFATRDWLTDGFSLSSVKSYQTLNRHPVFSHDRLVFTIFSLDQSIETSIWLVPAFQEMFEREKGFRQKIRLQFDDLQEISFHVSENDVKQCIYCKCFCYLSYIFDESTKDILCLDHLDIMKTLERKNLKLYICISDQQLYSDLLAIQERASIPVNWRKKFQKLLSDNQRPPLKNLKSLLNEAEKIPYNFEELDSLRDFVSKAVNWVEEAALYIARKQSSKRKANKGWRKAYKINPDSDSEVVRLDEDCLQSLLNSVENMAFDSPEIGYLKQKAKELENFKAQKTEFMNNKQLSKADWEDVVDKAKSMNIDSSDLKVLERHVKQLDWVQKFNDSYKENVDLTTIANLIQYGVECEIPSTNGYMQRLILRQENGLKWDQELKELLRKEPVPVKKLLFFVENSKYITISQKTKELMTSTLMKINEATLAIDDLMKRADLEDFEARPTLEEVRKLLQTCQSFPCKPKVLQKISKMLYEIYDWLKRIKKIFGKSNVSFEILTHHLLYVEQRNSACLSLLDRPRGPGEPVSRETTPDLIEGGPTAKSGELFCICRQPEHGMMIECDFCHEWYHGRCLKISKKKLMLDENFICPICDWRGEITRLSNRPRFEDLDILMQEAQKFSFRPHDYDIIASIVKTGLAYRQEIHGLVTSPFGLTHAEAPIIRFHLRKLEGAEILLAPEINTLRLKLHTALPIAPDPPPIIEDGQTEKQARRSINTGTTSESDISSSDKVVENRTNGNSIAEPKLPIENVPYCICKQPFLPNIHFEMINCESCDNWFHYSCVGLDSDTVETLTTFVCPECSIKQNQPYQFAHRLLRINPAILEDPEKPRLICKSTLLETSKELKVEDCELEGAMEYLNVELD